MTIPADTGDICCAALELSKTGWVCAFAAPGDSRASVHRMKAGDTERLLAVLKNGKAKAERELGRPVEIVLCHEVGYDGFWLARLLTARGHPHHRIRSGELSDAAPRPPRQDRIGSMRKA